MNTIYNHNINEFDGSAICEKLDEINGKIAEEVSKEPTKESNNKYRDLMYQQLMQGIKLCTGYRYF